MRKAIAAKIIVAAIAAAALVLPVAAEDEFIHCRHTESNILADEGEVTVYYSAVFLGDYSNSARFQLDFAKHIERELGGKSGDTHCFFENSGNAAQRAQERQISDDKALDYIYDNFKMTGWAPDTFSERGIDNFHMKLDNDSGEIQICMRDHECEDGDRVRISVDGETILEGEIFNDWKCKSFQAQAGQNYSVNLHAINGTGRKGNCSYRNVNTGEIRVSGSNTETQSWQHRGGAGSNARIIVSLSEQAQARREQEQAREADDQDNSAPQEEKPQQSGATRQESTQPQTAAPAQSQTQAASAPTPAPQKPAQNPNLCEFANDGECDEPHFCETGTDGNDCN